MFIIFPRPDFIEDIRVQEAKILFSFALGMYTETRPEDTEPNIRGRLKTKLMAYYNKRCAGRFDGDQLKDLLYQMWLYRTVAPRSFDGQILSFADLRDAILTLTGKTPFWRDRNEVKRLLDAA